MRKTLIIGPVFCDLLLEGFRRIPGEGEELFIDNINFSTGGAAITAAALARLGVETQIATVVGDDVMGQYLKEKLSSDNIDISSLFTAPKLSTGLTMIFPYEKDRGFITRPISDEDFTSSIISHLKSLDMNNYLNIHLTFSLLKQDGILQFINSAKKKGVSISLDIGYEEAKQWTDNDFEFIRGIDYFMPNDKEAEMITKTADITESLCLLKKYVKSPVVTLGEDGAAFLDEGSRLCTVPTFEKKAVNTTGAGDSFTAGFLYGQSRKLSLWDSVLRGTLTGSLTAASVDSVSSEISSMKIEKLSAMTA